MGGGQNEAESGSFRGNSGYPEGGALMPFIILARPSEYNIHKVLQELSAPMLTRDAYVSMRRAWRGAKRMCNIEITSLKPQAVKSDKIIGNQMTPYDI